jgi:CPA1 family monovalent cation:H+ antiporter
MGTTGRTWFGRRMATHRGPDARPTAVHADARSMLHANPEAFRKRFEKMRDAVRRYLADVEYLNREPLHAREGVLLTWAGMRGVVTVAAAQTLPLTTPHRPLLVAIAFTVAAGSLLIQGGSLPFVVRWLGLAGRDTAPEGERERLDDEMTRAGRAALDDPGLRQPDGTPYDANLLTMTRARIDEHPDAPAGPRPARALPAASERTPAPESVPAPESGTKAEVEVLTSPDDSTSAIAEGAPTDVRQQFLTLRLASLHAMREQLLKAQSLGAYTSATLRAAMAELDADELSVTQRMDTEDE